MIAARERGLPMPACGWCISPWVDLTCASASMTTKATVDPIIQKPYLQEIAAAYLGEADAKTPLASPLYADLRGLPPLLVQVGSAETLLDDSIMLAGVAGAADVRITLEIWPEMIHAWPLFHHQLAAGRKAIQRGAAYIREALAG
jgi:acetyl esterase/lipase